MQDVQKVLQQPVLIGFEAGVVKVLRYLLVILKLESKCF